MTGFLPGVAERIDSYVYALIDPRRGGGIFYVGKGRDERCFSHVAAAHRTTAKSTRDFEMLDRIREIEADGRQVKIDLLRHGLDEDEAFLVESTVIDVLPNLTNRVGGRGVRRMSVEETNASYSSPTEIDPGHRVVLIRINRQFRRDMTEADLYEATRKFWRVGAPRRKLGSKRAPEWAIAVYRGVARGVYRIEGWEEPTAADIRELRNRKGRWGFFGRRDTEMESVYLHRDVSAYLRNSKTGNPSQTPIRYVNCPD